MKKDINLLFGLEEAKKKSSSSMNLIMGVLVVALIGVMVFLFVSSQGELKDREDQIANLDSMIAGAPNVDSLEAQINQKKQQYIAILQESVKEVYTGMSTEKAAGISTKIFDILYTNYAYTKMIPEPGEHEEGKPVPMVPFIDISGLALNSGNITFSVKTRTYEDAWDFVDYLRGNVSEPQRPIEPMKDENGNYLNAEDKAAYDAAMEIYTPLKKDYDRIVKNKDYFSNVIESYPGLPPEGDGTDFVVTYSLSLDVNWGEIANYETN